MADDEATCGKGLAANAVLPEKLAALMGAMADLLENHVRSLDSSDPNGRLERDAYQRLVEDQRALASALGALASAMASYRDLPMAPHEVTVLMDQKSKDVFVSFIHAEEEAAALLRRRIDEHRAMLGQMNSG